MWQVVLFVHYLQRTIIAHFLKKAMPSLKKTMLPTLLFVLLLFAGAAMGQDSATRPRRPAIASLFSDSSQPSSSDYSLSIEKTYETLNTVNAGAALGHEVKMIATKLKDNDSAMNIVKENLSSYNNVLSLRNLQMYKILLADLQRDLVSWRNMLESVDKKITGLQQSMKAVIKDTLLMQLVRDSVARKPFQAQLTGLRQKWMTADSAVKINLAIVNRLLTRVSNNVIACSELSNQVNNELTKISADAFGKEINYLWQTAPQNKWGKEFQEALKKSYTGERKALNYYFKNSWGSRLLMLLTGLFFFWWVAKNFRRIKKSGHLLLLAGLELKYINRFSVWAALVVIFCLAPLFDLHPPAVYIETMQFLLMLSLTVLFWRRWPRRSFLHWCIIFFFFVLFSLTQYIISPAFSQRLWLLLLNSFSVVFGLFFLYRIRKALSMPGFVRIVTIIYIGLNGLAVICNMYGRFTLAKIFGTAAIFGLTQIIGLAVFIQILVEAILVQVLRSRISSGMVGPFNTAIIVKKSARIITFLALVLWVMVFAINLNIYSPLFIALTDFLSTKRNIGSTTFTIGNIALFFIIIVIANLLQKYVSYFFGDDDDDFTTENKGQRSRLMITRLIVITIGFLLAVAASGLPIDKITIVLGALGVGIGLGLQDIVNNLVSGIILIFERPMQIGDTIEIGDKAGREKKEIGRVKEIGIRSSKLVTANGAEVIVPNGDLLSQQFVNWTLSNNHVRLELPLKIASAESTDTIKDLLTNTIKQNQYVLQQKEPVILFDSISDGSVALKLYFWCSDINKAEATKSDVLVSINKMMKENNMQLY